MLWRRAHVAVRQVQLSSGDGAPTLSTLSVVVRLCHGRAVSCFGAELVSFSRHRWCMSSTGAGRLTSSAGFAPSRVCAKAPVVAMPRLAAVIATARAEVTVLLVITLSLLL